MKKQIFIFITLLLLCCFSSFAQASTDVLKLKNGNTVRGTITKETYGDNAGVTIDLGNGNVMTLKTSEIEERSRETPKVTAEKEKPTEDSPKPKGSRGFFTAGFNFLGPVGLGANTSYDRMFVLQSGNKFEAIQYASTGGAFSLDGSFIFRNSPVGIATSAQIVAFGVDESKMLSDIRTRGSNISSLKASSYASANLMAGLAVAVPINTQRNLYFDFRAMLGVAIFTPNTVEIVTPSGQTGKFDYASGAGACIQSDLGLRYNINRLSLRLAAVYTSMAAVDRAVTTSNNTNSIQNKYTMTASSLQGLGVGFHVGFTL